MAYYTLSLFEIIEIIIISWNENFISSLIHYRNSLKSVDNIELNNFSVLLYVCIILSYLKILIP